MRRLVVTTLVALVGIGGCVTPSIPIPPPDPSQMDFDIVSEPGSNDSHATFTYPPDRNYEGGTAYVFNDNTGGGVFHIVNPDFSIGPMTLSATLGDQMVITIESAEQTVSRCVVLRQGPQDPNTYCN